MYTVLKLVLSDIESGSFCHLDLSNDDLPGLLVDPLIIPVGIQILQLMRQPAPGKYYILKETGERDFSSVWFFLLSGFGRGDRGVA
jgi:hypothetical protein